MQEVFRKQINYRSRKVSLSGSPEESPIMEISSGLSVLQSIVNNSEFIFFGIHRSSMYIQFIIKNYG